MKRLFVQAGLYCSKPGAWLRWSLPTLALVLPAPARGDLPTGAILSWSAPAECPQADEFRADVERFLRQSLDLDRDQQLKITGVVRGNDATGFKGTLRVRGPRGTQRRELSHENCRELTEAAALVAALAIDPELAAARASAEPSEPSPAAPTVAPSEAASASSSASAQQPPASAPAIPPPVAAPSQPGSPSTSSPIVRSPPVDPREQQPRDWVSSVVLLGLVETGALPGGGLGLGARAAAGTRNIQVAAGVAYFLPRFVAAQGNSGIGPVFRISKNDK